MSGAAMIGEKVDKYEITERLGAGGMGAVYLARHTLIGRQAAVKMLLPQLSQNQEIVKRFFNEAKAATAIRHPGIVEIYDFGYHRDGAAYLVMEYLEGEGLEGRIRRLGRLPVEQAVAVTRQIASALAAAHEQGIVHRDLKPDNIFLVRDPDVPGGERIKILDFGIAKLMEPGPGVDRTRTGAVMGTPMYMAPEQCRGASDIDHRADLYALGCILYHMLCGRPPFVSEYAGDILAMHMRDQPAPPSAGDATLEGPIDALVLAMLAKDPAQRPASARAVADTLDRLTGQPASVPGHARATRLATADPARGTPPPASYPAGPTPMAAAVPGGATPARRAGGASKTVAIAIAGLVALGGIVAAVALGTGGGDESDDGDESAAASGAETPEPDEELVIEEDDEASLRAALPATATIDAGAPVLRPPTAADLADYTAGIDGKGDLIAVLETSKGTLRCKLHEDQAPRTVANFVGLARGLHPWRDHASGDIRTGVPYYDGTAFHRVVPGFMIQGGDPTASGSGGPGYTFDDEFAEGLGHDGPGVMSMANSGADTNGSQFFVMAKRSPHLDGKHSVFGRCDDPAVVSAIAAVPRDARDRPKTAVTLDEVSFERGAWKPKAKKASGQRAGGDTAIRHRPPQVRIGNASATGDLDKNIIRRYMRRSLPRIKYCYEKELLVYPGLKGTVTTSFAISPTGAVASASAKGVNANVASCVAGVIKAIRFPKPRGGGIVQVRYPFTFSPGS